MDDVARHATECAHQARLTAPLDAVAGLAAVYRHVIGCILTLETRITTALDDEASNIWQALAPGDYKQQGV